MKNSYPLLRKVAKALGIKLKAAGSTGGALAAAPGASGQAGDPGFDPGDDWGALS